MSVADSIVGALSRFGRPILLRRDVLEPGGKTYPLEISVFGVVKNYQPHDLVGGLTQGASEITITNAEITERQWPGPPKKGDFFIFEGRKALVEAVEPKYLGTEVLVFKCQVKG